MEHSFLEDKWVGGSERGDKKEDEGKLVRNDALCFIQGHLRFLKMSGILKKQD